MPQPNPLRLWRETTCPNIFPDWKTCLNIVLTTTAFDYTHCTRPSKLASGYAPGTRIGRCWVEDDRGRYHMYGKYMTKDLVSGEVCPGDPTKISRTWRGVFMLEHGDEVHLGWIRQHHKQSRMVRNYDLSGCKTSDNQIVFDCRWVKDEQDNVLWGWKSIRESTRISIDEEIHEGHLCNRTKTTRMDNLITDLPTQWQTEPQPGNEQPPLSPGGEADMKAGRDRLTGFKNLVETNLHNFVAWVTILFQLLVWEKLDQQAHHFIDTFTYRGRNKRYDPREIVEHIQAMDIGWEATSTKQRLVIYVAVQSMLFTRDRKDVVPPEQHVAWRRNLAAIETMVTPTPDTDADMPMPAFPHQHNPPTWEWVSKCLVPRNTSANIERLCENYTKDLDIWMEVLNKSISQASGDMQQKK